MVASASSNPSPAAQVPTLPPLEAEHAADKVSQDLLAPAAGAVRHHLTMLSRK